ncbi:DgyrCDS14940 [Dimorphilus gyrociliatus]|uniref:DgyrCDS14940 n=1 Tax=Dimorphilus gyrociliatus TaxID=2664684 RepID=A0A7I8WFF0_9ANNE|nr:DgyrCDS14940 [Dimorphilus gyrociliatus]
MSLQKKILLAIKKVQEEYLATNNYKEHFCLIGLNGKCSPALSFYNISPNQKILTTLLKYCTNEKRAFSSRTRLRINIGGPLKGFDKIDEHKEDLEMTKRYEDLLKDYAEKGDEYFENGVNGMEFYHFCPILLNVKIPKHVFTYATFWDKFKCCCCCKKNPKDKDNSNDIKKKNIIVRFFSGPYFKLITNRIARWFILAFFAGLFAAFVYFASTLKVNQEETKFLKDSSNYGRYLADASTKYKGNPDNIIKIYLVFGLKPQDRSDCYHTDFKCTGKQHWDNDFNLSSNKTQQKFLEFCQLLHNLKEENTKDLYIKRDKSTNVPEVLCFMKNMIEFYKNDALNLTYKHSIPFDVRTSHDIFANDNSGLYKDIGKLKGEAVNKHFELAMDWWLFNGTNPPPGTSPPRRSTDFALFNELLGEEKLKGSVTYKKHLETIVYGTKLKYAGHYSIENVERVDSGKSIWHWLAVQRILVGSAITGIAIGVGLSCPILIVATHNIFVGILATITIACVTVCVIGVLPIAGWKLGLMESLNSVLVVGLAVDYIVHLAEGYSRSVYKSREERVKDMLTQVGVSVLSGASTTLGASFFLLLGDLLFFVEFGAFMFATIGFSIVWALGFFSTILGMFGPQNNFGSLKPVYSWIISRCNRQQSSNQ